MLDHEDQMGPFQVSILGHLIDLDSEVLNDWVWTGSRPMKVVRELSAILGCPLGSESSPWDLDDAVLRVTDLCGGGLFQS